MAESVYKVVELVGTSNQSWEKAAAAAVKVASQTLRDLRIAEISQLDMNIVDGKVASYRAKVKLSFKYDTSGGSKADSDDDAPKAAPRRGGRAKAEPEAMEAPAPKKAARKAKRKPAKG
jgi:flavin-binding protein dodecin